MTDTATSTATSFESVLDSVIAERGGRVAFSLSALAAASALAHALVALANGDATGAASIGPLTAMLPPLAEAVPEQPKPDLTLLDMKELRQLERISEKAHGREPPSPSRQRELVFEAMDQYLPLKALAVLCATADARPDRRFSDDERCLAACRLTEALPAGETVAGLVKSAWFPPWKLAGHGQAGEFASAAAPVVAASPAPAAGNGHDNVVPLRPPA